MRGLRAFGALACAAWLWPGFAAAGTLTTIYSFTDGADGAYPLGGVIEDSSGILYGETYQGGATGCTATTGQPKEGCGTLYSFSPAGALKILVSFTGPNGAYGANGLTLVGSTLYGSTVGGGSGGQGVLFSVHTDGTGFTLLHQFSGTDGSEPTGPLRVGPGGELYGLTLLGGPGTPKTSDGVLFELNKKGDYTILHAFSGPDGSRPQSLLVSGSGALVGSTSRGGTPNRTYCTDGCGLDFSYVPSTGAFSVVYNFTGAQGGLGGLAGSIGPGPTLYGNDGYALYSLSKKAGFVNAYLLNAIFGQVASSGPLLTSMYGLLGVTGPGEGGAAGTLYSAMNGIVTALYVFGGLSDGGYPQAQPIVTPTNAVIGTTTLDGLCDTCGTIYEYTP